MVKTNKRKYRKKPVKNSLKRKNSKRSLKRKNSKRTIKKKTNKRTKRKNCKTQRGGSDEAEKCTICLSPFEAGSIVTTTECGHRFHQDCLLGSINSGSPNCPVCRRILFRSLKEAQEYISLNSAPQDQGVVGAKAEAAAAEAEEAEARAAIQAVAAAQAAEAVAAEAEAAQAAAALGSFSGRILNLTIVVSEGITHEIIAVEDTNKCRLKGQFPVRIINHLEGPIQIFYGHESGTPPLKKSVIIPIGRSHSLCTTDRFWGFGPEGSERPRSQIEIFEEYIRQGLRIIIKLRNIKPGDQEPSVQRRRLEQLQEERRTQQAIQAVEAVEMAESAGWSFGVPHSVPDVSLTNFLNAPEGITYVAKFVKDTNSCPLEGQFPVRITNHLDEPIRIFYGHEPGAPPLKKSVIIPVGGSHSLCTKDRIWGYGSKDSNTPTSYIMLLEEYTRQGLRITIEIRKTEF